MVLPSDTKVVASGTEKFGRAGVDEKESKGCSEQGCGAVEEEVAYMEERVEEMRDGIIFIHDECGYSHFMKEPDARDYNST